MTGAPLLRVEALEKRFLLHSGVAERMRGRARPSLVALDGVSLTLSPGEVLGVVGESGSGKSTLAKCLVRLLEPDAGRIVFDGVDVARASAAELRSVRRRMQLVYQDPYSSLNPQLSVGRAIGEPARVHGLVRERDEQRLVVELLERVGLSPAIARRRPRELSGGQRQRVAIARALALQPEVLIADEAVSALDVSVQGQILNLLADLRQDLGVAIVFVAHQLSVVAHLADRVAVMYLGRIVEEGPTDAVFHAPRHPYTTALLAAQPRIAAHVSRKAALGGEIPSPVDLPSGCRFRTRCPVAQEICSAVDPPDVELAAGHRAACHFADAPPPPPASAAAPGAARGR
jgi:oligopeptide/dipeptide ABC transporter ATP-binding protein